MITGLVGPQQLKFLLSMEQHQYVTPILLCHTNTIMSHQYYLYE